MKKINMLLLFIFSILMGACDSNKADPKQVDRTLQPQEKIDLPSDKKDISLSPQTKSSKDSIKEISKDENSTEKSTSTKQEPKVDVDSEPDQSITTDISEVVEIFEMPTAVTESESDDLDSQQIENKAVADKLLVNETALQAINHNLLDEMCKSYISSEGMVDYKSWKKEEDKLDKYLELLASNIPNNTWSDDESLAYWINAYNAFTIKLIIKNYPVKSIMDLENGDPWSVKWIELGDKTYSLNNIEHDIIRPTYNEPRIHFAVNCAAASCPPLKPMAYTATNLESLLEESTEYFINSPKYNKITTSDAKVSKIFEWYASDFGELRNFINEYSTTSIAPKSDITYLEYDWSLNGN